MMKNILKRVILFNFIILGLYFCFNFVYAEPIYNMPKTFEQPNNEIINCFISGDEFFNYICDENGYLIIKDYETGFYVYASFDSGEIIPTDSIVTNNILDLKNISKKITINDIPNDYIQQKRNSSELKQIVNLADSDDYLGSFVGKTINNLVIIIKFSDSPSDWPSQSRLNFYNNIYISGEESLSKYFSEVSYGQTKMNSVFCTTASDNNIILAYQDEHPRSYYENCEGQRTTREMNLLKNAVSAVKNNIPSGINLDVNNDGLVDCISFLAYGGNEGDIFWSHKWSMDSRAEYINGKLASRYTFIADRRLDKDVDSRGALGALSHETLHVLEFPDMYGIEPAPVGNWDVMGYNMGQHPGAYMKSRYGKWIDLKYITKSGQYTMKPLTSVENNSYAIKTSQNSDEYLVVEYRKKDSNGPFEKYIPDSGLLIYRVNDKIYGAGGAYIYRDSTNNLNNAAYKFPDKTYFGIDSDPASNFSNGMFTGVTISNVSEAGDSISFDVLFDFVDKRLEEAVREKLNKPNGELTMSDYEKVTELEITDCDSELKLMGIENLINLKKLNLSNCSITDVSCLSSLTNLEELKLENNCINSIFGFENLIKLKKLLLFGNKIEDYTPTEGYYNNLIRKDFFLNSYEKYDIISKIPELEFNGKFGTIEFLAQNVFPESLFVEIKKFNSSGFQIYNLFTTVVLNDEGTGEYNFIPTEINMCNKGDYVEILIYNNRSCEKLLCKQTIGFSLFEF